MLWSKKKTFDRHPFDLAVGVFVNIWRDCVGVRRRGELLRRAERGEWNWEQMSPQRRLLVFAFEGVEAV